MSVNTCPNQEQLRDYLQGALPPADSELFDEHLNECSECQAAMDTLEDISVPELASLFHKTPSPVLQPDPMLRQMVARAKTIEMPLTLTASVAAIPGLVLGNYELLEPIGSGGMGQVFRANHRRMKRVVALKLIPSSFLPTPEMHERFQREIEAAARLVHPNIVTAYDAGEDQGRVFLVMEYVAGQDLARRVQQNGPLPIAQAVAYIVQAARGLAHAHAAGIIHRDIKPANLLLDAQGVVKVLDLGLARLLERDHSPGEELTSRQTIMGTAAYMAPEQALNSQQAGPRADIYSLGCTLFYLLTGKPPFSGNTSLETICAHRDKPVPSLMDYVPGCPQELNAIVQKMLAKQPQERFASMQELILALEQLPLPATEPKRGRSRWLLPAISIPAAAVLLLALLNPFAGSPTSEPGDGNKPGVAGDTHRKTQSPSPANAGQLPNNPQAPIIDMVRIPGGEFTMGASDTDKNALPEEKPQHKVQISNAFYLGKYEITQQQYQQVMGTNPSAFSAKGRFATKVSGLDTSQHPVEGISWLDAVMFCNRLSEMHRLKPFYQIKENKVTILGGTGYRLPTEAEWEYACRANTPTLWSFGNDPKLLDDYAWYAANAGGTTHPVGKKKANAFGLFDMHGNVPEWCWDRYDKDYYLKSPIIDPAGSGIGSTRVYRGGSWDMALSQTRSSARHTLGEFYGQLTLVGLRIAKNTDW